jgi:hypothetical protein
LSFFGEFQRRHASQAGIAYLVIARLIAQVPQRAFEGSAAPWNLGSAN